MSPSLPLLLLLSPLALMAQIHYDVRFDASRLERELPFRGPGAALLNPAFLAETRYAHGHYGTLVHSEAKGWSPLMQGAAGYPSAGLAIGMAAFTNGGRIRNSSAIHHERSYVPMAAYSRPLAGSAHRLAVGVALPQQEFNAFGAIRTRTTSLDLGFLWTWEEPETHGSLRTGVSLANLLPPEVRIPDRPGEVALPRQAGISAGWRSPQGLWEAQAVLAWVGSAAVDAEGSSGFGLRSLALVARPLSWFALQFERNWIGEMSVGPIITYRSRDGLEASLETSISHDRLSGLDDDRGLVRAGFLTVTY